MGMEIDRIEFTAEEHRAYEDKLRRDLAALRSVLARPGFGVGPSSLGAELELHLVDAAGRPVPDNQRVLARAADPRLTLEVDRFNLEVNSRPTPLAGRPFSALREDLGAALASVRAAAAPSGAEPALIGILPTLDDADLGPGALTAGLRYQALSRAIRRLRGEPLPLRIDGPDHFELVADNVTFEGANTSFQVHLRVDPADFARTYNAAQIAVAQAPALSTNSPLFFGKRLWEETRIAPFRQSVDARPLRGARPHGEDRREVPPPRTRGDRPRRAVAAEGERGDGSLPGALEVRRPRRAVVSAPAARRRRR
ncbi:MAG: hypothetical protein FJ104_03440 [Deltaproteobacteria bacterium]|nr:hypothetical protein [Deltaproteobacteria bacterium]